MMNIHVEKVGFSQTEIEKGLQQLDVNITYEVQKIIYYPYLIFEYNIDRKNFFHPLKGRIGCTIDGVNQVGALADMFPDLVEESIPRENVIQCKITLEDASELAKDFVYESISSKKKVLTIPELATVKQKIFHRPYWIAAGKSRSRDTFHLTVDAVSGKFHPL